MIYTNTEVPLGDNTKALRGNLQWLQAEFEAHRISGKPFRELRDLYSKKKTLASPRIGAES